MYCIWIGVLSLDVRISSQIVFILIFHSWENLEKFLTKCYLILLRFLLSPICGVNFLIILADERHRSTNWNHIQQHPSVRPLYRLPSTWFMGNFSSLSTPVMIIIRNILAHHQTKPLHKINLWVWQTQMIETKDERPEKYSTISTQKVCYETNNEILIEILKDISHYQAAG